MIHVECPWCAAEATIDGDETIECATCSVRVDVAWAPDDREIARAA